MPEAPTMRCIVFQGLVFLCLTVIGVEGYSPAKGGLDVGPSLLRYAQELGGPYGRPFLVYKKENPSIVSISISRP
jgi:hypothetical protein